MRSCYLFNVSFCSLFVVPRNVKYEIVVIDDGSPDGTQDVVRALAAHYGEDKIVRAQRGLPVRRILRDVAAHNNS